ncbi:hypothetical protein HDU98_009038 [Podochytrium sp. JEL0797]|nr:hypothetical protein HDU98_009038 [Podochytrium sp. JEL0797]
MDNMISEIQQLISSDIESYVVQTANSLTSATDLQVSMFEANMWSFLPSRVNETMRGMLLLLNGLRSYTMDMYMLTVPGGAISGYFYDSTNTLQMWNQVGMTINTTVCDSNGYPLTISSTSTANGDGTIANPGNNNTLYYTIGGVSGANINYTSNTSHSMSGMYLWGGNVYKSTLRMSVNPVTDEKVLFANDWTVSFLSNQLKMIVQKMPYPMIAGAVEITSGYVVAMSDDTSFISADGSAVLTITQLSENFVIDLCNYLKEQYPSANADLLTQLSDIATTLANPSTPFLRGLRTISTPFVMQLSLIDMGDGHPLLLFQYIDQNAVLANMRSTSIKTGLTMLGIILLVVGTGTVFALLISRQLRIVASQISLLKQMKFNQVLGKDGQVQSSSFISELSEVQVLFYEMVVQFANTLKASKMMQQSAMGSIQPQVARNSSQQAE